MRVDSSRLPDWLMCQDFERQNTILLLEQLDEDCSNTVELTTPEKS